MTTTPPPPPTGAPTGAGPDAGPGSSSGDTAPPAGPSGPRTSRDDLRDLGRLRRTVGSQRRIAGVAGGLARHLDIDPVVVRVVLVVLVFFGGSGLLLYAAVWLLVPEDGSDAATVRLDDRNRAIALVVAGTLAAVALLGDTAGQLDFPWPLAVVVVLVLLLLSRGERSDQRPGQGADQPPAPETAPGAWQPATAPGATYAAPPAWQPATTGTWAAPTTVWQPPPNPRRAGPVLFWFTLALAALGIGVLGTLDLAGAGIPDPAYPALVVALCGAALVVGAFWGRAGGLVLVGLLAALAMAAATATQEWDRTVVDESPVRAADVASRYDIGVGAITVDLTGVSDLEALDGRTLRFEADAGSIEVVVPEGLDVVVEAEVGAGSTVLFGSERGGLDVTASRSRDGGDDVPLLRIDAEVNLGEIRVEDGGVLR